MKLLIISFFSNKLGGGEIHTYSLANYLSRYCKVFVLHFHNKDFLSLLFYRCNIEKNDNLIWIKANPSNYLQILSSIAKYIDLVIFPKATIAHKSVFLEFYIKRVLKKKLITIEHSVPFPYGPPKKIIGLPLIGFSRLKKILFLNSRSIFPDRIICVSSYQKEVLVNCYSFPKNKIQVVYNGIDLKLFNYNPSLRCKLRHQYGISNNNYVYGMIARLAKDKRIDLFLEAFYSSFLNTRKKLFAFIIGDGPEKANLCSLVRNLDLQDRVFFIDNTLKPWEYYSMFDFFVLSSECEAFPLVLLEAIACGCLPIATNVGGVKEIMNLCPLGWSVEPSVDSLNRAILESLDYKLDRKVALKRNRSIINENFNQKKQFLKIYNILKDIL